MATPRPIIETTLAAYADTGITRARMPVTAMPAATPRRPTASGSAAATTEPKTTTRNTSTSGSTTSSARRRSSLTISVKSWFSAIGPNGRISSVSERTFVRRAG